MVTDIIPGWYVLSVVFRSVPFLPTSFRECDTTLLLSRPKLVSNGVFMSVVP